MHLIIDRYRNRLRVILLALVACLVLTACGNVAGKAATASNPPSQAANVGVTGTIKTVTTGDAVPALQLTDIAGHTLSLANSGGKPTVLYFMAAWCATCSIGENALGTIHKDMGSAVRLITVDVDSQNDSASNLKAFQQQYGGNWPHVLDNGTLLRTFGVRYLDYTVFVNSKGTVADVADGPLSAAELKKHLAPLLKSS